MLYRMHVAMLLMTLAYVTHNPPNHQILAFFVAFHIFVVGQRICISNLVHRSVVGS